MSGTYSGKTDDVMSFAVTHDPCKKVN